MKHILRVCLVLWVITIPLIGNAVVDLDVGGEVRLRGEARENLNFVTKGTSSRHVEQRTRVHFDINGGNGTGAFIQLQDSRTWGSETSTAADMQMVDLHQGYFQFGQNIKWKLGRQELAYGKHRLIGSFGWNNVGRSFDAVKASIPLGNSDLDVFWSKVTEGTNTVMTDDVDFSGIYYKGSGFEPYVLHKNDSVNQDFISTVGLHSFGNLMGGEYDGEIAYQTGGNSGALVSAVAGDFGIKFGSIGIGVSYATGDDPATGTFERFDNLYPTNHNKYGFMDQIGWKNLLAFRLEYDQPLTPGSSVGAAFHVFNKAQKNDGVYVAGGGLHASNSGTADTDIGSEVDLTYKTKLEENILLTTGLSYFVPGKALTGTDASTWAYIMTGFKF